MLQTVAFPLAVTSFTAVSVGGGASAILIITVKSHDQFYSNLKEEVT